MKSLDDVIRKTMHYGLFGAKRALFITPMMYFTEIISGLHSQQSMKSRFIALGVNFLVAQPYNEWFKPKVYDILNVNETSPEYKKDIACRVAFATHQLPLYFGILAAAGASSEQIAITLPIGLAVGVATAGKFQNFMDEVSDFVKYEYYRAKDATSHWLHLGRSYSKNLAYATFIAVSVKLAINYVKENNIITNQDTVLVYDVLSPDAVYSIKKEYVNNKKFVPVFSEGKINSSVGL